MKRYLLSRDFGCETAARFHWSTGRDIDPSGPRQDSQWHPSDSILYENGGDTWFASGKVSKDSKHKLTDFWVRVVNAKASLKKTHVIGDYTTSVAEEVIVDEAFVNEMTELDPSLFDFVQHEKIWDTVNDCAPWDGNFYFATLLQNREAFFPDITSMYERTSVQKNIGEHTHWISARQPSRRVQPRVV